MFHHLNFIFVNKEYNFEGKDQLSTSIVFPIDISFLKK